MTIIPSPLPKHFALGLLSKGIGTTDLSWMTSSGIPWDYRYNYFSTTTTNAPGQYIGDGVNAGIIPIITRYTAPTLTNLNTTTFMATYYADFVAQLKSMIGWNLFYAVTAGASAVSISTDCTTASVVSATGQNYATGGNRHTSGKWVVSFSITSLDASGNAGIGLADSSGIAVDTGANGYLGASTHSMGIYSTGGVLINNVDVNSLTFAYAAGDTIDLAVDLGIQKFWARRDGGNWNAIGGATPGDTNGIYFGTGSPNGSNGLAAGAAIAPGAFLKNTIGNAIKFTTPPVISGFPAWNSSPSNPAMILHVEPDLWGFMQQQGNGGSETDNPANVPVSVASSGYSGLSGFANTAVGFAQAIKHLRDQNAPNVLLAWHCSTWADNSGFIATNSSFNEPPSTTGARVANFYNGLATQFDLIFHDTSTGDRDADYGILVNNAGLGTAASTWWWAAGAFTNYRQLLAAFHGTISPQAPGFLWQVPIGNTLYQACNDTSYHYQDNKVEYFLTANAAGQGSVYNSAGISQYIKAGIIGILFGPGQTTDTENYTYSGNSSPFNPGAITNQNGWSGNTKTATVSDDDGGFLRAAATVYYANPVNAQVSSGGANVSRSRVNDMLRNS